MTFKKACLVNLLGVATLLFASEVWAATDKPIIIPAPESKTVQMQTAAPSVSAPASGSLTEAEIKAELDADIKANATTAPLPPPPPPSFNSETAAIPEDAADAPVRISPSKSEIIHLTRDAASVIVSNPAHAAVLLDSPRVLIILPRAPGATSFTVLDSSGATIMEKKVLVSSGREPYVRVRKVCASGQANCAENSYYYCPDGCYEVSTQAISSSTTIPQVPPIANSAGSTPATPPTPAAGQGTPDPNAEDEDPAIIREDGAPQ